MPHHEAHGGESPARPVAGVLNAKTEGCKGLARQSRNQKNFTEANEGNEEQEKFCQKCAILGNSTAKSCFRLCDFCDIAIRQNHAFSKRSSVHPFTEKSKVRVLRSHGKDFSNFFERFFIHAVASFFGR